MKGNLIYGEAIKFRERIEGTRSHSLRLVIDNTSSKSTSVFLDNKVIGRFQQKFDSRLRGGVLIYNSDDDSGDSFMNAGLFKNFELSECKKINLTGVCMGGKSNLYLILYMV